MCDKDCSLCDTSHHPKLNNQHFLEPHALSTQNIERKLTVFRRFE